MRNHIEQSVYRFIKKNFLRKNGPLLLGLSGGPDSIALFHILLKISSKQGFDLHIAHVDHRWREESAEEAQSLTLLAKKNKIPFHLKTLELEKNQSNIEALCRDERLTFFKELFLKHSMQALLLGHHADDQAETVLKRVFEGASLAQLSSLQEVRKIHHMTVWRPFLVVTKLEIRSWLEQNKISYFEDSTNLDTAYLRGRMRSELIPQLSKTFGKEVQHSLCRLGKEALELKEFLDEEVIEIFAEVKEGPFGFFLDLSQKEISPVLIKHIFRKLASLIDLNPSRELVDEVSNFIENSSANRTVEMGKKKIMIDRKRLFLLKSHPPSFSGKYPLREGSFVFEHWKVDVELLNENPSKYSTTWLNQWNGYGQVIAPSSKEYFLAPAQANVSYPRSSALGKWWNTHKVPAFLRGAFPLLWDKNGVCHEFLTGQTFSDKAKSYFRITLNLSSK
jgi:tRNA(Ile)-lysidine synthase